MVTTSRRAALSEMAALGPLLAAAYGGPAAPTQGRARKAGEKITLHHVPWSGIQASRDAQTAVVQAWNQAHPETQVIEDNLAGDGGHYQRLLVQAAADLLPDRLPVARTNSEKERIIRRWQ